MLVYEWTSGELLGTAQAKRTDPASAFMRFKRLPLRELMSALTDVFRVHAELCARGWIANDFYDGAMMYDFGRRQITLVDLDMYRQEPFVNDMGRMFGSTRSWHRRNSNGERGSTSRQPSLRWVDASAYS
jgi:serine/threonine-protein kinase